GLVIGWLVMPAPSKPAINLDEQIVKTRLVKLGKERPPDWLPRIDAAPPPKTANKKAAPTPIKDEPKPQPDSTKKPSAADVLKNLEKDSESPADIIKKRLGKATDEGQKDGDRDGTALTGELKK